MSWSRHDRRKEALRIITPAKAKREIERRQRKQAAKQQGIHFGEPPEHGCLNVLAGDDLLLVCNGGTPPAERERYSK